MVNKVKSNKVIDNVIKEVNLCECAYIVKRPISKLPWIRGVSSNKILNNLNLEVSHEHIIFSDSKENIGFGPSGYFSDSEHEIYYEQSKCYDATRVRESIRFFLKSKNAIKKNTYDLFKNNCQHFIDNIFKYLIS